MTDTLKRYLIAHENIRVQTVQLSQSWQTGLKHQNLPRVVQQLLGELTAAAALLASNIKFDGSLVLQIQGDGPVALLVAECSSDLKIRATASLRENAHIPEDGSLQTLINHNGQGRFVVVLDPSHKAAGMQPYQGIVPLEGTTIAEALEQYMLTSEQLETKLWLASDQQSSAGLMLQRLPQEGGTNADKSDSAENSQQEKWDDLLPLFETVNQAELLNTESDTLMHRLLWQEELLAFEPKSVAWHCPCTRQRVISMLQMLGEAEVTEIFQEQNQIEVACNFCGKPYSFDAIDCKQIFLDQHDTPSQNSHSIH